jgi:hypothetical protein
MLPLDELLNLTPSSFLTCHAEFSLVPKSEEGFLLNDWLMLYQAIVFTTNHHGNHVLRSNTVGHHALITRKEPVPGYATER